MAATDTAGSRRFRKRLNGRWTRSGSNASGTVICIIDEFTRESIAIRVARTPKAADVIETLCDLFVEHDVRPTTVPTMDRNLWLSLGEAYEGMPRNAKPMLDITDL
jgi:hypothetical protein